MTFGKCSLIYLSYISLKSLPLVSGSIWLAGKIYLIIVTRPFQMPPKNHLTPPQVAATIPCCCLYYKGAYLVSSLSSSSIWLIKVKLCLKVCLGRRVWALWDLYIPMLPINWRLSSINCSICQRVTQLIIFQTYLARIAWEPSLAIHPQTDFHYAEVH